MIIPFLDQTTQLRLCIVYVICRCEWKAAGDNKTIVLFEQQRVPQASFPRSVRVEVIEQMSTSYLRHCKDCTGVTW